MDLNMIRKMQKLQKEIQEKQEKFMDEVFTHSKHGVTISCKGNKQIVDIKIGDPDLLDPEDPEILEDIFQLALNEIFEIIDEKLQAMMPEMPGGFGL
ncbi:YbaB/EbfC family nucleoid-associated protein [Mycoplasma sp. 1331]|uniref:Nucleoid-associated protein LAD73_00325 n=1 Tax=Mycoplasma tauri TaxID=547987 RepID=A0A953NG03_9MOLU|nr:YbaB/EbfC family nucleoid-associated protein [Mycoplasma tauri]MBZ4195175.1 YbaB/EbfC family nucleoid-associated protein [Mycoplasma tauri]QSB07456.1 YbaB/EbfC family nucleoid-associated protein [Mycoplasma tauri]